MQHRRIFFGLARYRDLFKAVIIRKIVIDFGDLADDDAASGLWPEAMRQAGREGNAVARLDIDHFPRLIGMENAVLVNMDIALGIKVSLCIRIVQSDLHDTTGTVYDVLGLAFVVMSFMC